MSMIVLLSACSQDLMPETSDLSSQLDQKDIIETATVSQKSVKNIISSVSTEWNRPLSRSNDYTVKTIFNEENEPLMYVVNFDNNNGFILIGTSRNYYPILAYSQVGNFNQDLLSGNIKNWVDDIESDMKYVETLPVDSIVKYNDLWRKYDDVELAKTRSRAEGDITDDELYELKQLTQDKMEYFRAKGYDVYPISYDITNDPDFCEQMNQLAEESIYPLYDHVYSDLSFVVEIDSIKTTLVDNFVQSTWDQGNGFNLSYPLVGNQNIYAGCGPVATGQLMYYYKYPSSFNWNGMNDKIATQTTEDFLWTLAQKENYKVGTNNVAVVTATDVSTALKSYGYSCSLKDYSFSDVYTELNAKRPVIVTCSFADSSEGHMWLMTGLKDVITRHYYEYYTMTERRAFSRIYVKDTSYSVYYYTYMNWGYGGKNDGMYIKTNTRFPFDNSTYEMKKEILVKH